MQTIDNQYAVNTESIQSQYRVKIGRERLVLPGEGDLVVNSQCTSCDNCMEATNAVDVTTAVQERTKLN